MPHKDPEARKAYLKAYHEANRDRLNADSRRRHAENRDARRIAAKRWRDAHREERCATERRRYWENREVIRAKQNAYAKANPDKIAAKNRRGRLAGYGLSPDDYRDHLIGQAGRCLICDRYDRPLVVDHDHDTGAMRGLLCGPCNRAIGLLSDRRDLLESAARYLTA